MNGLYTISNPNSEASAQWDSDYSTFKDVEYFEVALPYQTGSLRPHANLALCLSKCLSVVMSECLNI